MPDPNKICATCIHVRLTLGIVASLDFKKKLKQTLRRLTAQSHDTAEVSLDNNLIEMLEFLNWLSKQIRELEGLDAILGADVVLGLSKIQASQMATVMDRELSKRKRELQDKFGKPVQQLLAERINRGNSVSKICRNIGISTATFYNWSEEYDLI